MDENMPNLSGSEATKIIRSLQREQNLKYTPIVALTANAIKGDKQRFLDAGMDEYITKPIDKVKLTEVLVEFLNREDIYDMAQNNKKKNSYDDKFLNSTNKALNAIDKCMSIDNFLDIIRYTNLIKTSAMRYKYQDIFTICLNIEQSAKDEDKQSCINFIKILKDIL